MQAIDCIVKLDRFDLSKHWRPLAALALYRPRKALAVAFWYLCGKRMRALARLREGLSDHSNIYRYWLAFHQPNKPTSRVLSELQVESELLPVISLHLHYSGADLANEALISIIDQIHQKWVLFITSDGLFPPMPKDSRIHVLDRPCLSRAEGFRRALEVAQSSHIVSLSPHAALTSGALIALARAISVTHGAVLYADQDETGPGGRRNPWLKPQWDEDLFLAQDYLSDICALPVATVRATEIDPALSDETAMYALLANILLRPSPPLVVHVPYIAVTLPEGHWLRQRPTRKAIVSTISGFATQSGPFGTLKSIRPLPSPPPLVSVIVPTRDRADLLSVCISGVLNNTEYPEIEIVIADNGSVQEEALMYLAAVQRNPRVKVVRWPHPYNYSAVNNFAISKASGRFLCLLNNDTEVIEPAWLSEMVAHAVRPEVGAVGARLLYPDRSIQHAGVVAGLGNAAGHAHRGLQDGAPGYFAQAYVTRRATAVTAACLVVAKEKFERVGGLDERDLGIAYNDVDLCLKLQKMGWRNIYVPHAVLIHHESKSRGTDFAPEHLERYMRELAILQKRWGTVGFVDPTHHTALDPASEVYRLRL